MKWIFLLGAVLAASVGAASNTVEFRNAPEFAAAIRALAHSIRAGNTPAVPESWQVQTEDGTFSISTAPLKRLLDKDRFDKDGAEGWLNHLAVQAEQYAATPASANDSTRWTMKRILAQPEFAGNGPPGPWQRFRARVSAWMLRWLSRLLHAIASSGTGANVVFWLILAAAGTQLAFWIVQRARESMRLNLTGSMQPFEARSWDEWINAAKTAAHQGDLRVAVQCAYWAGVSRLQAIGALPNDLTHTPREYVRVLSGTQTAENTKSFRTLANAIERCWYACMPATPEDFSICLKSLEALGCKRD